jgi:hypothetical protein
MHPVIRIAKNVVKAVLAFNLVALAAGLIAKQLVPVEGDEHSAEFVHPTIMFGTEFKSETDALRHGRIFTLMGGTQVDFTGASLASGAQLEIITIMGGVEVRVPATWRIDATNSVMAGDAQMTLDGQDELGSDAPVLRVKSQTVMSGLVITNRPRRRTSPSPI